MKRTLIILKREFLTRVRKKSFIALSILGPLLLSLMVLSVGYVDSLSNGAQYILIVDETQGLMKGIKSTPAIRYEYTTQSIGDIKGQLAESNYTAALWIPENILASKSPRLFYKVRPNYRIIKGLERKLEERIEFERAKANNLTREDYLKVKIDVNLSSFYIDNIGREYETDAVGFIVSLVLGMMIYGFVFLYAVQVMRGIKEERSSKIIELLLSSVRPGQILMGKILGICLVSLLQLGIWLVLSYGLVEIGKVWLLDQYQTTLNFQTLSTDLAQQMVDAGISLNPTNIYNDLSRIEFGTLIPIFMVYLVLGYLLYASLFAIAATLTDPDSDDQQFVLPVTIPLALALLIGSYVAFTPDTSIGDFFAIFPLTSPVVMLVKVAMNAATVTELLISILTLIGTIALSSWMASKIYKGGVLFRGTKPSWKTIRRWVFSKQ